MGKFLALVLLTAVLHAADRPTVELSASPAEVAVGDPVTVSVTWTWPAGWQVQRQPDPTEDFRTSFVTDAPPVQATHTAEGERRVVKVTLLAERSGAWALPRPTLIAVPPTGEPVTVEAPAVIVQVGSEAKPASLPDPIPLRIRPPLAVTAQRTGWWIAGGATLVALAALALLLRRRATAAAAVPPADRFSQELGRLAAIADGRDLGGAISLALRSYAGAVFAFDAPGSTTREVAATLARREHPEDERRALVRLLERLDDLRWAPGELPADTVRPLADEAGAWVAGVERRLLAAAAAAKAGAK